MHFRPRWLTLFAFFALVTLLGQGAPAQTLKPLADATKDHAQVVSTADGKSLWTLYKKDEGASLLALLPKDYAKNKYFIAVTVGSGEPYAGLQAGDEVVYWRRYGSRLALVQPNLGTRSTGDGESKRSVDRLFTDKVLLDLPIVSETAQKAPLIDLRSMLLDHASVFFGSRGKGLQKHLASFAKVKAFPENLEVAFEVPTADGTLKILHYSISLLPENNGYKPRPADSRIGYFTTTYRDLGKYTDDEVWVRSINRWRIEKADANLALSPPKEPIVYYIEHTTPIRYRRFVRDGLLMWNEAFERIGIVDAIEVRYQDAATGAHMDKDPEDVRYNFIRWLNNSVGTAIGPSRVDPYTGQILDADIVLTDGWIRHYEFQFNTVIPKFALQGTSPETLAWLEQNPSWDPRVRTLDAAGQASLAAERAARGVQPLGGHPMANRASDLLGDDEFDGLVDRVSQVNGMCLAADGRSFDLAILRMTLDMLGNPRGGEVLDGVPAEFIGPLLADLVAHEVGHTLGLRHNFKASGVYTYEAINSPEVKGKPFAGSVMDYLPINFRVAQDAPAGDVAMVSVGPYDLWAIEYGYTFETDLEKILDRCVEPGHAYATDEDTGGPDPLARRYDFAGDPLAYANELLALAAFHRANLLEKYVADGDSWLKARQGYDLSLGLQTRAVSMMANWLGGSFISRHKKGDSEAPPIEPVSVEQQRAALAFVIEQTFRDEAYGLTPDLLRYLTVEKWYDDGGRLYLSAEAAYPVHDRILAVQASALTLILSPTTLRRIFDNERLVPAETDALTLPEVLEAVDAAAWTELEAALDGQPSVRKPRISSLRRNLQREHVDRLIDLALGDGGNAARRTIATLARQNLIDLATRIEKVDATGADAYTRAHLSDIARRIEQALEASYVQDH